MNSSCEFLDVFLPDKPGDPLMLRRADTGTSLRFDREPPPLHLRCDRLWLSIVEDWPKLQTQLDEAGAELGSWLFKETSELVREGVDACRSDPSSQPRRITLHVPDWLAPYPWEASTLNNIGALAVHESLTLLRSVRAPSNKWQPIESLIYLELVGVTLENYGRSQWEFLRTKEEVLTIHQQLLQAIPQTQLHVEPDLVGSWDKLRERIEGFRVPDVFHFAGHGWQDGSGLIFAGSDGSPVAIDAAQLAALLTGKRKGLCRLAILNACATATTSKTAQPFGSLAQRLASHGIPNVVGIQAPLADQEGTLLAAALYQQLVQGKAIDVAVQQVRRDLLLKAGQKGAWAFLTLVVGGAPQPVFALRTAPPPELVSARLFDFGFDAQRQKLWRFLKGNRSMVVVVHGREGSGHRHVAERVQNDLRKESRIIWEPVGTMGWRAVGEPQVNEQLLLGGIADALNVDTSGESALLRSRIVQTIRQRCQSGRVLVLDLVDLCTPGSSAEADAIVALVLRIWKSLIEEIGIASTFLLISIGYPRNPKSEKEREKLARNAVLRISRDRKILPHLTVEVLDELLPFEQAYIAKFLEDTTGIDSAAAEEKARLIAKGRDNESIIIFVKRILESSSGMRGPMF